LEALNYCNIFIW